VLPCDDDEEVEPVPGVGEVGLVANESHRSDLDEHLNSKEDEDGVIEGVEYAAASGDTRHVVTRLKHTQRDTVQQDDTHTDPLEPRVHSQGTNTALFTTSINREKLLTQIEIHYWLWSTVTKFWSYTAIL